MHGLFKVKFAEHEFKVRVRLCLCLFVWLACLGFGFLVNMTVELLVCLLICLYGCLFVSKMKNVFKITMHMTVSNEPK